MTLFGFLHVEKNEAEEQEAKQEIKRRLSRKVITHIHIHWRERKRQSDSKFSC